MRVVEVEPDADGVQTVWETEVKGTEEHPFPSEPVALVRETDVEPYVWALIQRGLRCEQQGECRA